MLRPERSPRENLCVCLQMTLRTPLAGVWEPATRVAERATSES